MNVSRSTGVGSNYSDSAIRYGFDKSVFLGLGRVANSFLYWAPEYDRFLDRNLLSHQIDVYAQGNEKAAGGIGAFLKELALDQKEAEQLGKDLIARVYQRFYSSGNKSEAVALVKKFNRLHDEFSSQVDPGDKLKLKLGKAETFGFIRDVVQSVIDESKSSSAIGGMSSGVSSVDDFSRKVQEKLREKTEELITSLGKTSAHARARNTVMEEFIWGFGLFLHEALLEVFLQTTGINLGGLDLVGLGAVQLYFGIAFFCTAMPYIIGCMEGFWNKRVDNGEIPGGFLESLAEGHRKGKENWDNTVASLSSWHPVVDGLLGSFFGFGPWVLAYVLWGTTSHKVFYPLMSLGLTLKGDLESSFKGFSFSNYGYVMTMGLVQGIFKDVQKIRGLSGFQNMAHDARITIFSCAAVGLIKLFLYPPKKDIRSLLPA